MAEADTANPQQQGNAAANDKGALTLADVQKTVTETVAAALQPFGTALGDLTKGFAALQQKQADAAAAATATSGADKGKPQPVTLEDVQRTITQTLTEAFKTRDAQAASTAARNGFIADKMKGLPAAYQNLLGNDPSKWATEEQAIRAQFKADAEAAGLKFPDVGSGNPGGASGSSTVDPKAAAAQFRNLSPGQAAFAASLKIPN